MSDFGQGARTEDAYFAEQEAKTREALRRDLEQKAKAEHERRELAATLGSDGESLATRIQNLGFDAETASVVHLMPLVAVAWADGSISANERSAIMQAAAAHGIEPHTRSGNLLASVLERRPDAVVGEEMLAVLRDMLAAQDKHPHSLIELCADVAEASGGVLGFGNRIHDEEQKLLDEIAASLKPQAAEKARELTQQFE
jgi:tellurite resistance protein